ncbi:hypothetical protein H9P43_009340 [Blastocladiella emersonii ATCC 22665]|nr:hypothetical protein H9P43_009340 [Blastocladiella emersonii ATCC 22665]
MQLAPPTLETLPVDIERAIAPYFSLRDAAAVRGCSRALASSELWRGNKEHCILFALASGDRTTFLALLPPYFGPHVLAKPGMRPDSHRKWPIHRVIRLLETMVRRDIGPGPAWKALQTYCHGKLPIDLHLYVKLHTMATKQRALNAIMVLAALKNRNGKNVHDVHLAYLDTTCKPIQHCLSILEDGNFAPDFAEPLVRAKLYSACRQSPGTLDPEEAYQCPEEPNVWTLRTEPYSDLEWRDFHAAVIAAEHERWRADPKALQSMVSEWERIVRSSDCAAIQALIDLEYPGAPLPGTNEPLDAAPLGVNGLGLQMITVVKCCLRSPRLKEPFVKGIATLRGRPWHLSPQFVDLLIASWWGPQEQDAVRAFLEAARTDGRITDELWDKLTARFEIAP